MKKRIIIFSAAFATLSLMTFSFVNRNDTPDLETSKSHAAFAFDLDLIGNIAEPVPPDFIYNVDSRFIATITKEDLYKASSIIDIVPEDANWSRYQFEAVRVTLMHDNEETSETGDNATLNNAQIELLRSTDHSDNFYITASRKGKYEATNYEDYYDLAYYLTVTPEKEALYINGHAALLEYLKENSKVETANVEKDKLKPGKLYFTVTKTGTISNVELDSTSGYPSIDETMIELITNMPGKWEPAENGNGEKVDQALVFSFGIMGC